FRLKQKLDFQPDIQRPDIFRDASTAYVDSRAPNHAEGFASVGSRTIPAMIPRLRVIRRKGCPLSKFFHFHKQFRGFKNPFPERSTPVIASRLGNSKAEAPTIPQGVIGG